MFPAEKIDYYKEKYGFSYQMDFVSIVSEIVDLKGKRVLDVGGSNLPRELVFRELQASKWISVDDCSIGSRDGGPEERHYRNEPILTCSETSHPSLMPDYCLINGRVETLPHSFDGQFDVVVSIAAFEHVVHLPRVLDRMCDLLVPGGIMFSAFSPIWSSCWGHHTWPYEVAGKLIDDGAQFIPEWGHLTMSPSEMFGHLCQHTSLENADNVVYQIYHSERLNRYFVEDYRDFLLESRFSQKFMTTSSVSAPSPELQEELERRYPGRKDFSSKTLMMRGVK